VTIEADERADSDARLSVLLLSLAEDPARARVSIGDLAQHFGGRAFGALLVVFAAPNVLPLPPGTSSILGLPLLYLTFQMMLGRRIPWLPGWILARSFERGQFLGVVQRLVPWLRRAEALLRPRVQVLTGRTAEGLLGVLSTLLAVILFLPIPLGNNLPGLAITLFALGLVERDGAAIAAGLATSFAALAVVSGVVYGMLLAGLYLLQRLFGL